ncbi:hypothetical protein SDJN03_04907, partial [Cucurbita argyrosperma subsp. sororia]
MKRYLHAPPAVSGTLESARLFPTLVIIVAIGRQIFLTRDVEKEEKPLDQVSRDNEAGESDTQGATDHCKQDQVRRNMKLRQPMRENTNEALSLQGTTLACNQSQTVKGGRRGKKERWQVPKKLKKRKVVGRKELTAELNRPSDEIDPLYRTTLSNRTNPLTDPTRHI